MSAATEQLLTAEEVAAHLKVTPYTVKQMARDKTIPAVWVTERTRRFRLSDVLKALAKRKRPGGK